MKYKIRTAIAFTEILLNEFTKELNIPIIKLSNAKIKDSFLGLRIEDKDEIIYLAKKKFKNDIESLKNFSDNILNSGFPQWHYDNFNKVFFSLRHRNYFRYTNNEINGDLRLVWEKSRFHFIPALGFTYWLTEDERYYEYFIKTINNWVKKNPYPYGVNWVSPMEAAIRVINLMFGAFFLKELIEKDEQTKYDLLKFITLHGKFIFYNIEKEKPKTNHYISNLLALLFISLYFPEIEDSKRWFDFSKHEFIKQIFYQTYEDGGCYESSLYYHRLDLEFFYFGYTLLTLKNIDVNFNFVKRLEKMVDFLLYNTKPDGTLPQIGDNDNGRLFKIYPQKEDNVYYIFQLFAPIFPEKKLKFKEFPISLETFILMGLQNYKKYEQLKATSFKFLSSKYFSKSGFYVFRKNNKFFLFIFPNLGQEGFGGHNHSDIGSFILFIDGKDIFIDPGTGIYMNKKIRNILRSIKSHNFLSIGDKSILGFEENEIFKSYFYGNKESIDIKETLNENIIEFNLSIGNKLIKRKYSLEKDFRYLLIEDEFSLEKSEKIETYFILSPDVKNLKINDGKVSFLIDKKNIFLDFSRNDTIAKLDNWFYSPFYGYIKKTPRIVLTQYKRGNFKNHFTISLKGEK